MKTLKMFVLTFFVSVAATAAQASIVLIDLNAGVSNAPAPDSNGRFWNGADGLSGLLVTDAFDQDNNATTIDINVTDSFAGNTGGAIDPSAITNWDGEVTADALFLRTDASPTESFATIEIEGLVSGQPYNLTFYGSRNAGGTREMDVTIGATTQTYDGQVEGLVTFASIAASGSGEISVNFSVASGSTFGYLNAIQIETVPEPSSLTFLGFGILGLTGRIIRRRRES